MPKHCVLNAINFEVVFPNFLPLQDSLQPILLQKEEGILTNTLSRFDLVMHNVVQSIYVNNSSYIYFLLLIVMWFRNNHTGFQVYEVISVLCPPLIGTILFQFLFRMNQNYLISYK